MRLRFKYFRDICGPGDFETEGHVEKGFSFRSKRDYFYKVFCSVHKCDGPGHDVQFMAAIK